MRASGYPHTGLFCGSEATTSLLLNASTRSGPTTVAVILYTCNGRVRELQDQRPLWAVCRMQGQCSAVPVIMTRCTLAAVSIVVHYNRVLVVICETLKFVCETKMHQTGHNPTIFTHIEQPVHIIL